MSEIPNAVKSSIRSTPKPYAYASIYDYGLSKGVVYLESAGGPHDVGRAVCVEEKELPWSVDSHLYKSVDFSGYPECDNDLDGYDKRRAFRRMPVYHRAYPAAGYCAQLEDKWYFPKLEELVTFCPYFKDVNNALISNHYEPFKLNQMYWSVTEDPDDAVYGAKDPRYAFGCIFREHPVTKEIYCEVKQCLKTEKGLVRPFLFFGLS